MTAPASATAPPACAWVVYCDGSAPPRLARMGLGAVVHAPADIQDEGAPAPPLGPSATALHVSLSPAPHLNRSAPAPLARLSAAAPFAGCNNEAELRALALALAWLQAQGVGGGDTLVVYSDSAVLVEQLRRSGPPPAPITARLEPLCTSLRGMLAPFGSVVLHWIPRHHNGAADALARAALGLAPKAATPRGGSARKRRR